MPLHCMHHQLACLLPCLLLTSLMCAMHDSQFMPQARTNLAMFVPTDQLDVLETALDQVSVCFACCCFRCSSNFMWHHPVT
jgi:hypothetical protein